KLPVDETSRIQTLVDNWAEIFPLSAKRFWRREKFGGTIRRDKYPMKYASTLLKRAKKEQKQLLVCYGDCGRAHLGRDKPFKATYNGYRSTSSTSSFPNKLKQTVQSRGGIFIEVDEYHTSKLCPCCHNELSTVDEKRRMRKCGKCGFEGNRDYSAAYNIAILGLKKHFCQPFPSAFIRTGKSTVAKILAKNGVNIIDCDSIVRELQKPGQPIWMSIKQKFGEEYFDPKTHEIDREKLGQLVFANPYKLNELNRVSHPHVFRKVASLIFKEWSVSPTASKMVCVDIPLLYESKIHIPRTDLCHSCFAIDQFEAQLMSHRLAQQEEARREKERIYATKRLEELDIEEAKEKEEGSEGTIAQKKRDAERKALKKTLAKPSRTEIELLTCKARASRMEELSVISHTPEPHVYDILRHAPMVTVSCSKEQQLSRLMKRNHLSEEDALKRIHSQMDIETKARLSDFVIDNSGSMEMTERVVNEFVKSDEIFEEIESIAAKKRGERTVIGDVVRNSSLPMIIGGIGVLIGVVLSVKKFLV
ncbi:Dephospho-CoA kinase like protein, partial [Aduncisulcus paluster]